MASSNTANKIHSIFLDFDGVLFDTVREAYVVSLITLEKCNNITNVSFESDNYSQFLKLRYLIGPASDYLPLFIALEDKPNDVELVAELFLTNKKSLSDKQLNEFQNQFFLTRKKLRTSDFNSWIDLHRPYEFYSKVKSFLNRYPNNFSIITTKDNDTVSHLLSISGVTKDLKIYGAKEFSEHGSKRNILQQVMISEELSDSLFIDDSRKHLDLCDGLDGLTLIQPDWGYLAPGDCGTNCIDVLNQIEKLIGKEEMNV